jgi:hypothetical protein
MKGNCDYQPPGIIEYGKTGTGQVLFNIERNDKEVEGETHENWDFDFCEVPNFKRENIIAAVVRSRYTQDEAEAILANYAQRKDVREYLAFQEWRNLAKSVASGKHLKSELAEHYEKQLIQVKMPLSFVLTGGRYEILADRVLKLNCPYEISIEEGVEMVTTWLAYIEPEHAHIQNDEELKIELISV